MGVGGLSGDSRLTLLSVWLVRMSFNTRLTLAIVAEAKDNNSEPPQNAWIIGVFMVIKLNSSAHCFGLTICKNFYEKLRIGLAYCTHNCLDCSLLQDNSVELLIHNLCT